MNTSENGGHGRLTGFGRSAIQADLGRLDYILKEASAILEKYRKADPTPRFKQLLNVDVQILVTVRKHLYTYKDSLNL